MAADLSRYDDVLALLTALPQRVPALQVVVVNGSAVTGGWDDHSDLDVEAWCSGDAVTTYDAVLALLRDELPVDSVWELPEATWPDGRQCFVHLQPDAADLGRPTRLLDLVILTTPERLTMDTRRHGTPIVLHDPEGLLHLEDDDEARDGGGAPTGRRADRARRQTAAWLVERAIARDDLAEATLLHLRFARRAAGEAAADPALPGPLGLRAALPAHRPARRVRGAGGSSAARAGPGGPVPGSVRVAGRGPGSAQRHFTKRGVNGGFHHSPL